MDEQGRGEDAQPLYITAVTSYLEAIKLYEAQGAPSEAGQTVAKLKVREWVVPLGDPFVTPSPPRHRALKCNPHNAGVSSRVQTGSIERNRESDVPNPLSPPGRNGSRAS